MMALGLKIMLWMGNAKIVLICYEPSNVILALYCPSKMHSIMIA